MSKILISSAAAILLSSGLTACNKATAEKTSTQSEIPASNPADSLDVEIIGRLPATPPSAKIAAIQTDLSATLLKGMEESFFTQDLPKTDGARISTVPGDSDLRRVDGKRILWLVVRHLEPVPPKKAAMLSSEFCTSGELYSGYAAPDNQLYFAAATESVREIWTMPHGLLVCHTATGNDMKLIASDHAIFEGEKLPDIPSGLIPFDKE